MTRRRRFWCSFSGTYRPNRRWVEVSLHHARISLASAGLNEEGTKESKQKRRRECVRVHDVPRSNPLNSEQLSPRRHCSWLAAASSTHNEPCLRSQVTNLSSDDNGRTHAFSDVLDKAGQSKATARDMDTRLMRVGNATRVAIGSTLLWASVRVRIVIPHRSCM